MKNKKSIIIAVVFILLVVLYFVMSTSSCGANKPETPDAAQSTDAAPVSQDGGDEAQSEDVSASEEASSDDTAQDAESQPAAPVVVLENEGDLEITVPDGMEQDGF